MQLTKYQHACFAIEKDNKLLPVDPGNFTTDLPKLENIKVVVITHEHPDHCDPELIKRLVMDNPQLTIYTHKDVAAKLPRNLPVQLVKSGDVIKANEFTLEFFGTKHATIHSSIPQINNLGVLIDNKVYYPGDSFTNPERPVHTLLLPVSAPWMKLSQSIDFLNLVNPQLAIPTHDAILSDSGKQIVDRVIGDTISTTAKHYERVNDQAIDLA